MSQEITEVPIVRKDQQPLRFLIQPTDRNHSHRKAVRKAMEGSLARMRVHPSHDAARFMEGKVTETWDAHGSAGAYDVLLVGIHLAPELVRDFPIDDDFSSADELLALAPRAEASPGQDLL
jgi:hypothetical protein